MQVAAGLLLQIEPVRFAAIFAPHIAQNIRHGARCEQGGVAWLQATHQAHLLLELVGGASI